MNQTMIERLSLAPLLEGVLGEITAAQVDRVGSKLDEAKKGEKKIGELTDDLVRRLYCASNILNARATESKIKAHTAPDDNAEESLKADAEQTHDLAELIKQMFWYEVQSMMGMWVKTIGIRKNWTIVETVENSGDMPEFLKRILGES